MTAEENDLVGFVLDQIQIGFEPIVLLLRKTCLISPRRLIGRRTYDIVHHDDVRLAAVERVVGRTETLDEIRLSRIGVSLFRIVVVIAHAVENRQGIRADLHVRH